MDRFSSLDTIAIAFGTTLVLGLLYATAVSAKEHEGRATRRLALLAILLPLPYFAVGLGTFPGAEIAGIGLVAATGLLLVVLGVPTGRSRDTEDDTPRARIDERDIMFSRRLLEPGTERFEDYYRRHPERLARDDAFRERPGLLKRGSSAYDPHLFSAADASFWTIERLRASVDGEAAAERVHAEPAAVTSFLKTWALKLGAVSVGVTELRDYHLYTVVGRGDDYGRPVTLDHRYAIAVAVEMDRDMVATAPLGPTVMESAQQYVHSGVIAVQLAAHIRNLGYPARAHIDGNYRVVCPLVARDAGLGEIGRMGLLMTPTLGPRVRLAVVTTDLPLVPNGRQPDPTVIDFCRHCRKCADACPSHAIPAGDRGIIDGVKRWQIDQEACYAFWCQVGTDCARCMAVCPYSHPSNALHDVVRWGVQNSAVFRRAAIVGDDLLYGKRPEPRAITRWMNVEETSAPSTAKHP